MENLVQDNLFDNVSATLNHEPVTPEAVEPSAFYTPDEALRDPGVIGSIENDYKQVEAYDRMMKGEISPEEYYKFSGYDNEQIPTQDVPDPNQPYVQPTDTPIPMPVAPQQTDPLVDEFNTVREYVPIMKYLAENPDAVEVLKSHIQNSGQQQVEQGPTMPVMPTKPEGFNATDALNDPDSPSAKFYEELMDYNVKVGEYQAHLVQKEQERIATEQQKRMVAEQTKQVYGNLISKHGMTPQEAQDFVKTMSDQNSLAMDNLVSYYRFMKGQSRQAPAQVPQRGVPQQTVKPQARMHQQPQQQLSDSDLFNMQLFAAAKKRPLMP